MIYFSEEKEGYFDELKKILIEYYYVWGTNQLADTFVAQKIEEKKSTYQIPLLITLNNLMPTYKKSHVKGTISLCYCRGHNCIMLVFCFEGKICM